MQNESESQMTAAAREAKHNLLIEAALRRGEKTAELRQGLIEEDLLSARLRIAPPQWSALNE